TLSGWIPNPYFIGFNKQKLLIEKDKVLMVSRLDGPSDKIVKKIIDDSINAEDNGLKGIAYFDARWPDPGDKKVSGYGFYDKSIHRTADIFKKTNIMPVVKDDTNELFKQGECPEAAIYCGWYRLSNYVDAFVWQPGSIGYHIASGECTTLKSKNSRVWCKMMLEKGVAATVGPVGEPYVQAFPVPEIFFGFLADGNLTLAECYIVSLPYLSWKMVLVGDPLYRPFKNQKR
ncbi:MAG: TIGR03790 family protein, partial [Desulfobacterales bacterium]|nr:TIGR03790 family protein [Desulfobacterales bacterium]